MAFFMFLIAPVSVHAQSGDVVLWNKLGSVQEVTHSEIGPNGNIVGSSYAFEPAQFGNGYIRKSTGGNWVTFPASVFSSLTRRGTIAVWINPKVSQPQPYQYGIFGLVGCAYCGPDSNFYLVWGDGVTGRGIFGGINLGNSVGTDPWGPQYVATPGVPFHVALSYDISGIGNTTDTIRTYVNGVLISKASGTWNPNLTPTNDIILGFGPDGGGYNKFITDNIVIYDYAKTDFSDRFDENPGVVSNCDGRVNAKVTASGFIYSRSTKTYHSNVYVKNTGSQYVNGPVSVVFKNLPAGVTLLNPSGTSLGSPYKVIPSLSAAPDVFAPNQTVSFPVQFNATVPINFSTTVCSGSLAP
jgi:hypothetical protein